VPRLTFRALTLVAALCLGLLTVVVVPTEAHACSCQARSIRTAAEQSDAVFVGRVLDTKRVRRPAPGRTDVRFEVSRVYKGSVYREQVVATPTTSPGCDVVFDENTTWVVFAEQRLEGSGNAAVLRLVTELCNGNLSGSTVPSAWGQGRRPLAGASDREERAVTTDATFTRALKVGGVLVGGLVVLVGVGLAILWRPGRTTR